MKHAGPSVPGGCYEMPEKLILVPSLISTLANSCQLMGWMKVYSTTYLIMINFIEYSEELPTVFTTSYGPVALPIT
jgi:hypothetical protein